MSGNSSYNIRVKSDKELEIVIKKEDHTMGNLLAKALMRVKGVDASYYRIEHPLREEIVLYVRTDGSITPINALLEATKMLKEEFNWISEAFEEELKRYEKRGKVA